MNKKKHPSDYYCYLCKKWHRVYDTKDKNRLINFHKEWKDKKRAEGQEKK